MSRLEMFAFDVESKASIALDDLNELQRLTVVNSPPQRSLYASPGPGT
jgi:hypothetical protein